MILKIQNFRKEGRKDYRKELFFEEKTCRRYDQSQGTALTLESLGCNHFLQIFLKLTRPITA